MNSYQYYQQLGQLQAHYQSIHTKDRFGVIYPPNQLNGSENNGHCLTCGLPGMHTHTIETKEKWTMISSLKMYVQKHSDVLWTLATVILLDHFLFEGKFRTKIESIMESLITKAEDKVKSIESK